MHTTAQTSPPSKTIHPNAWSSTGSSLIAGALGRAATNIPTYWLACAQKNAYPKKTQYSQLVQHMLIGTSVQTLATYSLREILEIDDTTDITPRTLAANFVAGAMGGIFMQPSSVAFFNDERLKPAKTSMSSLIRKSPELAGIITVIKKHPHWLQRGLLTRPLVSGLDWMIYFTSKEGFTRLTNEERHHSPRADFFAATTAIVATTPLYQIYIQQLQGKTSTLIRSLGKGQFGYFFDGLRRETKTCFLSTVETVLNPTKWTITHLHYRAIGLGLSCCAIAEREIVNTTREALESSFKIRTS